MLSNTSSRPFSLHSQFIPVLQGTFKSQIGSCTVTRHSWGRVWRSNVNRAHVSNTENSASWSNICLPSLFPGICLCEKETEYLLCLKYTQSGDFHPFLWEAVPLAKKTRYLELFLLFGLKYPAYCVRQLLALLVTSGRFSFCLARSIHNMTLPPSISSRGLFALLFCLACVFPKDPCICMFYFRFPLQLMEMCQLELWSVLYKR